MVEVSKSNFRNSSDPKNIQILKYLDNRNRRLLFDALSNSLDIFSGSLSVCVKKNLSQRKF